MEFISLKEVLRQLDEGTPFSMSFVTCDRKRKTGGEIIKVDGAVKSSIRGMTTGPRISPVASANQVTNHYRNATRNITVLSSGQTRKVHIWLITRFNDKRVHW